MKNQNSVATRQQQRLICLAIFTQYRRVTDGWMDSQTDILRQWSLRYAQHHAVKTKTYTADRHLVGSEGPGLVGADDGRTAESFYGRKTADDCVLLRHSPGSECQTCCDDSRQAFWDCSHRQCHSNLEVVHCTLRAIPVSCSTI